MTCLNGNNCALNEFSVCLWGQELNCWRVNQAHLNGPHASVIPWQAKWWWFSSHNLRYAKGKQSDNARQCRCYRYWLRVLQLVTGWNDDLGDEFHCRRVWNKPLLGWYNVSFVGAEHSECPLFFWSQLSFLSLFSIGKVKSSELYYFKHI